MSTTADIPLPAIGTPEYQALLAETGRTNLDGFNYAAHIAATSGGGANNNTANPNTPITPISTDIPLPEVGSPEYQALLLETGRTNLDGFNYAAHLAVKKDVSLSNFDQFYNASNGSELVSLFNNLNINQLMASASSNQVQSLVLKFANDPVFAAYLNTNTASTPTISVGGITTTSTQLFQSNDSVPLPEFGSDAYKALLLETGRSDLLGFNYAAHLAVKSTTSLANFDSYFNAADGASLVQMLGQTDINALMAQASPEQVQQLVSKFANDAAFKAFLNSETKAELPAEGTPAYQALLLETGRTNLIGFDYDAHLKVLTEAHQLLVQSGLSTLETNTTDRVGTIKADKLVQTSTENGLLSGGEGADKLFGNNGNDVLIGGAGADQMTGGKGDDTYYIDDKKDKIIEVNKGGVDTVVSQINVTLGNNIENALLNGGNLNATGNAINNHIIGTDGINIINGGLGNDTLIGGAGQDTFLFSSRLGQNNIDTIVDLSNDTILLDKSIFKSLAKGYRNEYLCIQQEAQDPNDFLIFYQNSLYYDPDGSGAKSKICFATLTGSFDTGDLMISITS